jgi:hypothetical protein
MAHEAASPRLKLIHSFSHPALTRGMEAPRPTPSGPSRPRADAHQKDTGGYRNVATASHRRVAAAPIRSFDTQLGPFRQLCASSIRAATVYRSGMSFADSHAEQNRPKLGLTCPLMASRALKSPATARPVPRADQGDERRRARLELQRADPDPLSSWSGRVRWGIVLAQRRGRRSPKITRLHRNL